MERMTPELLKDGLNAVFNRNTALIRTLSGSFTAAWHDDCDEMNNLSKCYD